MWFRKANQLVPPHRNHRPDAEHMRVVGEDDSIVEFDHGGVAWTKAATP